MKVTRGVWRSTNASDSLAQLKQIRTIYWNGSNPIRSPDLSLVLKPGEMRLVKIRAPFEVKYAHVGGRPLEGAVLPHDAETHRDW